MITDMTPTIRDIFGERLRENVPLGPYTSARIGGPADYLLEVRSAQELKKALPFRPAIIMLDNMGKRAIAESLRIIAASPPPHPLVEISGGVTEKRLPELKKLGVRDVSVGALTTQARNVDISMHIRRA